MMTNRRNCRGAGVEIHLAEGYFVPLGVRVSSVMAQKRNERTLIHAAVNLSATSFAFSTSTGNFFPLSSKALSVPARYRIVVSKTLAF